MFDSFRKRELMDSELNKMMWKLNEQCMKDYDFFCGKIAEVRAEFAQEIKVLKQEIKELKEKVYKDLPRVEKISIDVNV